MIDLLCEAWGNPIFANNGYRSAELNKKENHILKLNLGNNMKIEDDILLNQYAQNLVSADILLERFNILDLEHKRKYLSIFIGYFIMQSKPINTDIQEAIINSKLNPTHTPCVLLIKGGVATHNLLKISNLPEYELNKVFRLLLSLFRIAYLRRYELEKGHPEKWWYWDLSDQKTVERILEETRNLE